MKRNMGRKLGFLLLLLFAACLWTACGEKEPPEAEDTPESNQTVDYSGRYTDKQGTSDVYSELELRRNEDGTYAVTVGIYRVATLEGTADGALRFASDAAPGPAVEGTISIDGGKAEMTITASDFPEIPAGTAYQFPDGE